MSRRAGLGVSETVGYAGLGRRSFAILEEQGPDPDGWPMKLETLLSEVDRWPVEDRIRLVQEIWDRLVDQGHEPDLNDELKAELDRRLEAHRANPRAAIPWERMEAEALARLRR